jgi:hypothetical protein
MVLDPAVAGPGRNVDVLVALSGRSEQATSNPQHTNPADTARMFRD